MTTGDGAATRTHRLLGDPSRARILALLDDSARPLAAGEVAAEVGLHPTTVRFHLELLADAKLVMRSTEIRTERGRPRTLYACVPAASAAEPEESYRLLAELLAARLSGPGGAASAATAGFSWGQRRQPLAATPVSATVARQTLHDVFAAAGFDPCVTEHGNLVLRQCPFIDVARNNPAVVCSVHLGMAQGVLHQLGAPLSAAGIRPSIDGPRCLLRLDPTVS